MALLSVVEMNPDPSQLPGGAVLQNMINGIGGWAIALALVALRNSEATVNTRRKYMSAQQLTAPSAPIAGAPEWMSMDDFCEALGVSVSTAYKWSSAGPNSGRFPRFRKLLNGSIRIRRDWFDEWVDGLGPSA